MDIFKLTTFLPYNHRMAVYSLRLKKNNGFYSKSITDFSNHFVECSVLDIMRRDAEKDPAVEPNALMARLLINQVPSFFFSCQLSI